MFDRCRIESWKHAKPVSYITAPSTPAGQPGYLFVDCTVGQLPRG